MELLNIIWRGVLIAAYFNKSIQIILFTDMNIATILAIIVGFYFIVMYQLGCWYYHYISETDFWKPNNKLKLIIHRVTGVCYVATDWMGVCRKK